MSTMTESKPSVVLGGTLEEKSGIGLGCMSVSGQYSNGVPLNEEEATAFFQGVYDAGCRHFDTAEVYKSGELFAPATHDTVYNETQLGRFFKTVPRNSFTVATKYMPLMRANKCDYDNVKAALCGSLKRLGLEYVDVYYNHVCVTCEASVEFAASVKRLVAEGLVLNLGLSEVCADWIRAAHVVHPVCCVQQEWSLLTRHIEAEVVPTCRDLGVGIVAYSPLARNLLTVPKTRPEDKRRENIPRFSEANFAKNSEMLAKLEELALQKNLTPAQLSLAWLYKKAEELGVHVLPIPGTAKLSHALDNMKATRASLAQTDMMLLEDIARHVAGARETDHYIAQRVEGQEKRKVQDPKEVADAIIAHAEGFKTWPETSQKWFTGLFAKGSEGVDEAIVFLVEHHANSDGLDPSRVMPGATIEQKNQVIAFLRASEFGSRIFSKL